MERASEKRVGSGRARRGAVSVVQSLFESADSSVELDRRGQNETFPLSSFEFSVGA